MINNTQTFLLEHELWTVVLSIFSIQMDDQLESVQEKITETGGEIDRIKALPAGDPERPVFFATLPSLYSERSELRKQETILLEESRKGNDFVTRALGT